MNCGSSAGIMEKPARPRISAAHMAATTGTEGAAAADRARVTLPRETPVGGAGVLGVDDRAGGNAIDRLVIGNTASVRPSITARDNPQLIASGDASGCP